MEAAIALERVRRDNDFAHGLLRQRDAELAEARGALTTARADAAARARELHDLRLALAGADAARALLSDRLARALAAREAEMGSVLEAADAARAAAEQADSAARDGASAREALAVARARAEAERADAAEARLVVERHELTATFRAQLAEREVRESAGRACAGQGVRCSRLSPLCPSRCRGARRRADTTCPRCPNPRPRPPAARRALAQALARHADNDAKAARARDAERADAASRAVGALRELLGAARRELAAAERAALGEGGALRAGALRGVTTAEWLAADLGGGGGNGAPPSSLGGGGGGADGGGGASDDFVARIAALSARALESARALRRAREAAEVSAREHTAQLRAAVAAGEAERARRLAAEARAPARAAPPPPPALARAPPGGADEASAADAAAGAAATAQLALTRERLRGAEQAAARAAAEADAALDGKASELARAIEAKVRRWCLYVCVP
jgi:hypothetical protein